VGALAVLRGRELLAERRIGERLRLATGVRGQHAAGRTHVVDTGLVPRLELADQRDLHAADEADDLRVRDEPGDRADEKAALVLAKPEARQVRQLADAF